MEGWDSANGIKSEPGLCISGDLCRLSQRSLRPPALSHGNSPLPFWPTACLLKKIMHQMIGSSATTLLHTNLHFCTVLLLRPPSIASSICFPIQLKNQNPKTKTCCCFTPHFPWWRSCVSPPSTASSMRTPATRVLYQNTSCQQKNPLISISNSVFFQ